MTLDGPGHPFRQGHIAAVTSQSSGLCDLTFSFANTKIQLFPVCGTQLQQVLRQASKSKSKRSLSPALFCTITTSSSPSPAPLPPKMTFSSHSICFLLALESHSFSMHLCIHQQLNPWTKAHGKMPEALRHSVIHPAHVKYHVPGKDAGNCQLEGTAVLSGLGSLRESEISP